MKKNLNIIWRVVIAAIFVLSLGLTTAVPAAAANEIIAVGFTEPTAAGPHLYWHTIDSDNLTFSVVADAALGFNYNITVCPTGTTTVVGSVTSTEISIDGTQSYTKQVNFVPALVQGQYDIFLRVWITEANILNDFEEKAITVETADPQIAITYPLDGGWVGTNFGTGPTPTPPTWINGTVDDAVSLSLLADVDMFVQRIEDGWYWNGSSFENVTSPIWLNADYTDGAATWYYGGPDSDGSLGAGNLESGHQYKTGARVEKMDSTDGLPDHPGIQMDGELVGYADNVTFVYDDIPPTVTTDCAEWVEPLPDYLEDCELPVDGWVNEQMEKLTGTATDNMSGVDEVYVQFAYRPMFGPHDWYWYWDGCAWLADRIDDNPVIVAHYDGSSDWYICAPTLTNGRMYVLTAWAVDNAGNESEIARCAFIYDTEDPFVCIELPQDGDYYDGFPEIFGGMAFDSYAEIQITRENEDVTEYWKPVADATPTPSPAGSWVTEPTWLETEFGGPMSWYYDRFNPPAADGDVFTVNARATDLSGNESVEDTVTFYIDLVAPEVTIDPVGNQCDNCAVDVETYIVDGEMYYVGEAPVITGTATDDGSGVYGVWVEVIEDIPPYEGSHPTPSPVAEGWAYMDGEDWSFNTDEEDFKDGALYHAEATAYDYTWLAPPEVGQEGFQLSPPPGLESETAVSPQFAYVPIPSVFIGYPFVGYEGEDLLSMGGCHDDTVYLNDMDIVAGLACDNNMFWGEGAVHFVNVSILNNTTGLYWSGTAFDSEDAVPFAADGVQFPQFTYIDPGTFNIFAWAYDASDAVEYFQDANQYTICAVATDNIGQDSYPACITFVWDTTDPVVTIEGGLYGTMRAFGEVWGTAADNGSGINPMEVWVHVYPASEDVAEGYNDYDEWFQADVDRIRHSDTVNWYVDLSEMFGNNEDIVEGGESHRHFDPSGDYIFDVKAYDKSSDVTWLDDESEPAHFSTGNVSDYASENFTYEYTQDSIVLYEGLNFISFPGALGANSDNFTKIVGDLTPIQAIYAYNAFYANSEEVVVGRFEAVDPDASALPLDGYWVVVDLGGWDTEIAIGFDYDDSGMVSPPVKNLKGNAWNAIGPTGYEVRNNNPENIVVEDQNGHHICPVSAPYQLAGIEGSWSHIIYWDNACQSYTETYIAPGQHCYMHMGQGYWIFIDDDQDEVLNGFFMTFGHNQAP